ncbi:Clp protease N-terminal domain-containing protein [Kineosporia sp. NBRC 101731]|uniref:Clp protease N-terminal domain-containing protein n=1 Tax=Kineosporia sp. NBRC 101731 TaxID=3032199 RepID=UPI0024A097ED|nr:Clp protease N-terminal domain-containing protein [Kineosporia sp. NBRC 101731]GLY29921.1 hypothetical protein Kisp02_32860 [Kineosporia sp. NBRC 101731]
MTTTARAPFPGSDEFNQIWTRAFIHADESVGTHHLLRGMMHRQPVRDALDAYDITEQVLRGLVQQEADETGDVGRMLAVTVEPTQFSSAAAAALDRAQDSASVTGRADRSPVDVLLAMLGDSQCRATGILAECGADIAELRDALREGRVPARHERLPASLHRTRDALIGRVRYEPQGRGVVRWLRKVVLSLADQNLAANPVLWVRLEAAELAREKGRRLSSDDVLLALLTTHQVALAYPHLVGGGQHRYGGGQALAAAGLDHDHVRDTMAVTDLGRDALPPPASFGDWPQDTRQVLERLVCVEGNRSARLLSALGVGLVPDHTQPMCD